MRGRIAAAGVSIMLLSHPSAAAEDICGAAMERLDAATADAVQHAVFDLAVSSAAGETFAFHAQRVYGVLIKRREDHARLLAVALLRAYCVFLTRRPGAIFLARQEPARRHGAAGAGLPRGAGAARSHHGGRAATPAMSMPLADRPASEHPKEVWRWVLEQLAVRWTRAGPTGRST
jgi:hypothetical protein